MSNRAKTLLLIAIDALILFISLSIVIALREKAHFSTEQIFNHYFLFCYIFILWIIILFIEGLYTLKTYNPANLSISIIRGCFLSALTSVIGIYFLPLELQKITPKTNLILTASIALVFLYVWRKFFFKYFSHDNRLRNVILVGSQETIDLVSGEVSKKPHLGYKIEKSYLSDTSAINISSTAEIIAIERDVTNNTSLYNQIFSLLGSGVEVIDLALFAEKISGKIPLQAINESWFIEYCGHSESKSYDIVKNIIDRSIALVMIIGLIPVMIVLFPILLIVHGRPIFFSQNRTGLNNKMFTLYKLRSMVTDAEKNGAQWAKPGDARVTPLGKLLRKTRLDELPQLINILKGEMSLVGPRPERPEIISKQLEPSIPFYKMRHLVKPGVTGWAQVTFRYGFSQEDSKEKLQYDLYYVKNRSPWLDILVLFKTVKTVLTGAGQ